MIIINNDKSDWRVSEIYFGKTYDKNYEQKIFELITLVNRFLNLIKYSR